ncbi:lysozyme family protein [Paenibacillus larvae]
MLKRAIQTKANMAMLSFLAPVILTGAVILIFIVLFISIFGSQQEQSNLAGGTVNVSEEVLRYQPLVEQYAKQEGIPEYVGILLAIMMQESGGRGNDPMQSSESLCGRIGCITDPDKSIEQGVKHFAAQLKRSNGDLKLAIQSYNFGGGFIDFAQARGGTYTKQLAIQFSQEQYKKVASTGNYTCLRPEAVPLQACYGDINYVDAVLAYYNFDNGGVSGGGQWAAPISAGLRITSDYGIRVWPNGSTENHKGVDFAGINGVTPILAVADGRVVYSSFHTNSNGRPGYGNLVIVQHAKDLYSHYAHMSSRSVVVGQPVKQGQQLGILGATGNVTGPHLHLEAKTGLWDGHTDPKPLLGM